MPKGGFGNLIALPFQKSARLEDNGITVVFRPNIHQKFAVMDQKTLWYGSINLLSYGNAQESIMRIESANIANE